MSESKTTRAKKIAAVTAGTVAVAGAVTVGIKAWKRRKGILVVHAEPDAASWQLRVEGGAAPAAIFDTKREAVTAGRAMAHERPPSRLVIHRADGSVQTEHNYEA